jgi:hypothetical protein
MATNGVDLQYTMGMDEKAYIDGLNRARQQTQQFNTTVENNVKQAAGRFSGHFKAGFGQAAFAVQDFAVVLGQGGSNSLGRALMSASNNIGMLGSAFGPMGMLAATGASVLAATLLPAMLNAADGTQKLTDAIDAFLAKSNQIGQNVNFGVGLNRQLQGIMQGGGGGLAQFQKDLKQQNDDIGREMAKLRNQFDTSTVIIEDFDDAQKRIKDDADRQLNAAGQFGDLDAMDRIAKERDKKLADLKDQQTELFRLQEDELKKRFPGATADQLKQLTELQKKWGDLADKMREVENAQKAAAEAANRPVLPQDVPAHLRYQMDAVRAEIDHWNKRGVNQGGLLFGAAGAGVNPPGANKPGPVGGMKPVGVAPPAQKQDWMLVGWQPDPNKPWPAAQAQQERARRLMQIATDAENQFPPGADFDKRAPAMRGRPGSKEWEDSLKGAMNNNKMVEEQKRTNDLLQRQLLNGNQKDPVKVIDHF